MRRRITAALTAGLGSLFGTRCIRRSPWTERGIVMGRLRPSSSMVVALAALVLSASGVAYATTAGSSGSISACVKRHGGTLYVAHKCANHDAKLVWNITGSQGRTGPQGPQGQSGPQGLQGASGATKVVERQAGKTTETGHNDSAVVQCNSGEVATGGGWEMDNGNVANFLTFGDFPVKANGTPAGPGETPTGWAMSVFNNSGQTDTWHVYAICASP
jgi:hypothetical protein